MNDNRLTAILQIFTIILVIKSISATYFATKYSMENQLWIISKYANIFRIIPIFLFISLVLISLPIIFNINERTKKYLDWISLFIIFLSLLTLFVY